MSDRIAHADVDARAHGSVDGCIETCHDADATRFLHAFTDGIVVVDVDDRVTYVSPSAAPFLVATVGSFGELIHNDDRAAYRLLRRGSVSVIEVEVLGPTGTRRLDLAVAGRTDRDELVLSLRPTERRLGSVLRDRELSESIMESFDLVLDVAADGTIRSADSPDPALAAGLDSRLSARLVSAVVASDRSDLVEQMRSAAVDRHPVELSFETIPDRRFESLLLPHGDAANGWVLLARDVSERAALRVRSSLKRSMLDLMSESIVALDPDGFILEVNRAAVDMIGFDVDEVVGVNFCELVSVADRAAVIDLLTKEIVDGEEDIIDVDVLNSAGTARTMEIIFRGAGDGDVSGLRIASIRDLSEKLAHEREMQLSRRLEAIGSLAAGIAHEINTPMQYVSDNLAFLAETVPSLIEALPADHPDVAYLEEELPDAIEQMEHGIATMTSIVTSMRVLGHDDGGRKSLVDLREVVQNCLVVARATYKNIADVIVTACDDLPGIVGYSNLLHQAVLNIVVNASHAIVDDLEPGCRGRIEITVENHDDEVVLTVDDDGPGVPPEIAERIFQPFYTTKEVGVGTGQGLAIVRSAVAKHAGRVSVDASPIGGARFRLELPVGASE